jgi:fluoroacetyl-CoA thioesterase
MTEPQIGAIATADPIVTEADCANALRLSDDPRDQFPAVFATTRMIALMELAGARLLHPLLLPGEIGRGTHKRAIVSKERLLAGAAKRK